MEQTVETTKTTTTKDKLKHLAIFWTRMLGWIGTGVGMPIGVFAYKFGLFESTSYTTSCDEIGNCTTTVTTMNGWGIASCLIVGIFLLRIFKYIRKAYSKEYSLTQQCVDGVLHVMIPLGIAYACLYFLNGVIQQLMYCIGMIMVSELFAIPLNPLPELADRKGYDYSDVYTLTKRIVKDYITKDTSNK